MGRSARTCRALLRVRPFFLKFLFHTLCDGVDFFLRDSTMIYKTFFCLAFRRRAGRLKNLAGRGYGSTTGEACKGRGGPGLGPLGLPFCCWGCL
jgi:hypothetical protein